MNQILKTLSIFILIVTISFASGDDKNKFGKEISLEEKTKISDILSNPEDFLDETVLVEGEVLGVCPKAGCWMELASDEEGEKIKVKVKDGEIVFPVEAKGNNALVEGKVYKINLSEEKAVAYYKHIAEELGQEFDPATVTGPVTIYQLKGIGAEIDME
jgi:hypothetical protein